MTTITICKHNKEYVSFESKGHAEYDDPGYDIVCAAISILTINTLNSIEKFTDDDFQGEQGDGYLRWDFIDSLSDKAKVLMDALIFGLETIQNNYGNEYMNIIIEEV
ncbi:MAG: ribosomal-processing cysteine protease Prp [Lachnospiraceae bacterium]|nr:ribosomal-processing cysteine protease Prp [Lachnospiraceae bacterium]MDD3617630.1 ribosomal-processing cysteine protease Prp [Lachnospiraceae bacterium]